jgi:hypothetical protein
MRSVFNWLFKSPAWDNDAIHDEWFRAHFEYAATLVNTWLGSVLDVKQARLLDYGCGDGITDLGMALKYQPKKMIGVDITNVFTYLKQLAAQHIKLRKLPRNLAFCQITPGEKIAGRFEVDAIFTWSTFEHIDRRYLDGVVADLFEALPFGGFLFLQIEPLYYSPFGSHLERFVKQPWAHLMWDEATLKKAVMDFSGEVEMKEISFSSPSFNFADYKAAIFHDYLMLNRLTADELKEIFCRRGFTIVREERRQSSLEPPVSLKERYSQTDLLTNEIVLLLQKSQRENSCRSK